VLLDSASSGRRVDGREKGVERLISSDTAEERKRETHGQKDGYDDAKIHHLLEGLAPFSEHRLHGENASVGKVVEKG
jgi:hypothetical protein